MIWSSFILDELAGLRADAAPSRPECTADPRFLVDNTGLVTALSGPDAAEPAQFGEILSWAVASGAAADPASRFVQFMMNDGYADWLGFAPEGKFPARTAPRRSRASSRTPGARCRPASTPRSRWPTSTRPRCSTRSRAAPTRSADGASSRARVRWSEPPSASSRSPVGRGA